MYQGEQRSYFLRRVKKTVRRILVFGLAACIMVTGGMIANAASLRDTFDADKYVETYDDVRKVFGENEEALWKHYKNYGLKEGRTSGGFLDVVKYREAYPDLDAAFGDNWDAYVDHYLTYGLLEGRENFTDFDAKIYADNYHDLKEKFGYDVLALYEHYQKYGKAEGRNAQSELLPVYEERNDNQGSGSTGEEQGGEPGFAGGDAAEERTHKRIQFISDDREWRVSEYDGGGKEVKATSYNSEGKVAKMEKYEYDSAGNRIKVEKYDDNREDSLMSWDEISYDTNGKKIKTTSHNADGTVWSWEEYTYDGSGKEVKITTYNSEGIATLVEDFVYDGSGKLTESTVNPGPGNTGWSGPGPIRHTVYEYDESGNIIKENYFSGSKEYTYDENGNETLVVESSGGSVFYSCFTEYYDRIIKKTIALPVDFYFSIPPQINQLPSSVVILEDETDGAGNIVKETLYNENGEVIAMFD